MGIDVPSINLVALAWEGAQAGILVAESFPDHCDAMALLNATAQLAA